MSYGSKRTITEMLAGVAAGIGYAIYALKSGIPSGDTAAWAKTMLIFIGIGIGALIIVEIIFHIALAVGDEVKSEVTGQKTSASDMLEDEMDKTIEMKSGRIGYSAAGLGIVALLIALACGVSVVIGLHILLSALIIGSIAEGIAKLFYYERGVR